MSLLPQSLTQLPGPLTRLASDLGWACQKYNCMVQCIIGLCHMWVKHSEILAPLSDLVGECRETKTTRKTKVNSRSTAIRVPVGTKNSGSMGW